MFKKHLALKITLILTALAALSFPLYPQTAESVSRHTPGEFRGLWVASVVNLDYPSTTGLTADQLKAEAVTILNQAQNIGFNAVILQVRPCGDAFYPSELFPWSVYISGTQDIPPSESFDPLAFWLEEAHKRNIELHAWINPFRMTRSGEPGNPAELSELAARNPAIENPGWRVLYTDGNYYLDPGIPEARDYIVKGIAEIVKRYDVDGIHFDDYFYPGADFSDDATYETYGSGQAKDQWRRANVNHLVQTTHDTITDINPSVRFGISPAGIWQNSKSTPRGSQTSGSETYSKQYADSVAWIENQWIDYICPQIYWEIGFPIADYNVLLDWWSDAVRNTSVDLYIGQAAYRTATGKTIEDPWYGTGEIVRQLSLNQNYPEVKGHIMFRYGSFTANPILSAILRDHYLYGAGRTIAGTSSPTSDSAIQPVVLNPQNIPTLMVGRPTENTTTSHDKYCLLGASDPRVPLKMNGETIETRTEDGYFSVFVSLSPGSNSFVFTQDNQKTVTRLITYRPDSGSSGGSATPPAIIPTPSDQSPLAQITVPHAYVYPSNTTTGGPCGELMQGQTDTLAAATEDGQWIRLGIGVWIQSKDIQRLDSQPLNNTITAPQYTVGDKWDTVSYTITQPTAHTLAYDGHDLTLTIRGSSDGATLTLPESSPFAQHGITIEGSGTTDITRQSFTLKSGQKIDGYYTEIADNTLTLHIKKKILAADAALPLFNTTILLDPGHGGNEPGALGPLGNELPEKIINISATLKVKNELEKLGATVQMTHDGDEELSLNDRVEISRATRPDLFLSIHANSLETYSDGARAMGVSTWHRERVSEDFCSFMCDFLWNDLNRPQTGSHQANFYVCRPTWTPSFIIETGFVCNPQEFSWLVNVQEQERLANSIARGVAAYFMTP